jgi:type II secretory pathway component PulF
VVNDRIARALAWGASLLCSSYVVWRYYQFSRLLPAIARLIEGLGGEIPRSTRFVISVPNFFYEWAVAACVIVLFGKELVLRDTAIRLAITVVVFISAAWCFDFGVSALIEPLVEIMRKIS